MTTRTLTTTTVALAALLALTGCNPRGGTLSPMPPARLVVMTHDSFAISDSVLAQFESAHGIDVQILTSGDAGSMVNQAILTKDNPLADVLFGVDNTFLSRALDAGIFDPYVPSVVQGLPETLTAGTRDAVAPIDFGDVCVNYDKDAFGDDLALPARLEDLIDPSYAGKLVVENPATSSPGLAFLLATVSRFGEDNDAWEEYWRRLRDNDVLVDQDWETAYYGSFSGGAGEGDRPLVVSYATSPAAEVVFADPPVVVAPTGVVTDGCFRQVEYAGVLMGTEAPVLARQFVDFMLSDEVQADIPLNMYVFPVRDVELPEVFVDNAAHVIDPIQMDPAQIAANRDRWVQEWTDVVLR